MLPWAAERERKASPKPVMQCISKYSTGQDRPDEVALTAVPPCRSGARSRAHCAQSSFSNHTICAFVALSLASTALSETEAGQGNQLTPIRDTAEQKDMSSGDIKGMEQLAATRKARTGEGGGSEGHGFMQCAGACAAATCRAARLPHPAVCTCLRHAFCSWLFSL